MYKAQANPKEQIAIRKSLRSSMTPAEATLWRALKGRQIYGLKFRRQHGIGPYVMDFYCPTIKLCIELDGEIHNNHHASQYDTERTRFLNENGIRVLRFENDVVWKNIDGIVEAINSYYRVWTERQ